MRNYKLYKVTVRLGCVTDNVEVYALSPAHARRLAKYKLQELIDTATITNVELVYGEKNV